MSEDRRNMQRCIELAQKARDAGDHPFGAVIVDETGAVVAEERNRENTECDVTWHAEIGALRKLTRSMGTNCLEGMTLYTSGEPCIMCAAAIRKTGVSRVVFGAHSRKPFRPEPHPFTDPQFAENDLPEVQGGYMEDECLRVQGRGAENGGAS